MLSTIMIDSFLGQYNSAHPTPRDDLMQLRKDLFDISNEYMRIYYGSHVWHANRYKGVEILKFPNDLWIYGEIIYEVQPDLIIETGTWYGGSAIWFGDQLNSIGKGQVISIDIDSDKKLPPHDRVTYLKGSSLSRLIIDQVTEATQDKKSILVNLDSDHDKYHVLKELEIYSGFVTPGSYCIVEDTVIGGHPVDVMKENGEFYKNGPWEAVEEFMRGNKEFIIDTTKERFHITHNPHGYLKRRANGQ